MTTAKPCALDYVCLDLSLQKDKIDPKSVYFPLPDFSQNADSQGLTVLGGQVKNRRELGGVLQRAAQEVKGGKTVLVDVRVLPDEYPCALEKIK